MALYFWYPCVYFGITVILSCDFISRRRGFPGLQEGLQRGHRRSKRGLKLSPLLALLGGENGFMCHLQGLKEGLILIETKPSIGSLKIY